MKLHRTITKAAFRALSPAEKQAHLFSDFYNNGRPSREPGWLGHYPNILMGEMRRGTPEYQQLLDLEREAIAARTADGEAFRAKHGIPAEARLGSLTCSVAKNGSTWRWCLAPRHLYVDHRDIEAMKAAGGTWGDCAGEEEVWRAVEEAGRNWITANAGKPANPDEIAKGEPTLYIAFLHEAHASIVSDLSRALARAARRARPASKARDASANGELFFTRIVSDYDGQYPSYRQTIAFRIVKRTGKRVFFAKHAPRRIEPPGDEYRRDTEFSYGDEEAMGIIDRAALAEKTKTTGLDHFFGGWWKSYDVFDGEADYKASLARIEMKRIDDIATLRERLKQLQQERVDAHPDKGGTEEAFIAANEAYNAAKAQLEEMTKEKAA